MVKSSPMRMRRVRKGHSPMRPPLQKRTPPTRFKTGLQKTMGASRRIKLIDANPRTKSKKKIGGTSVIFVAKDSMRRKSGIRIGRVGPRMRMNHTQARVGVDFFCNLGQRVHQLRFADRQKRLPDDEGGLPKAIVRGRPMAGRLEAGRLEAGGLGTAVAKVNGLSTGGPRVGAKRGGIDLAEVSRGTELTRAVGLGTLSPGPVLNSCASLAAKDVVVPLTNRLPIIDFISTNEFNRMNETQKTTTRRYSR